MKISIIVGGRFHAFDLAEHLDKEKYLKQLITSYPKYYIKKKFNINEKLIKSIFLKELLQRSFLNKLFKIDDYLNRYFDYTAMSNLEFKDLDILIGWSSFSYCSFLKAKNEKCISILERGSTHIEYQNEILKEEYELLNLKPKLISKYIIDKEKKEYELADYIMVPTEYAKKTFIDKGVSEKKIIKNYYGVDLSEFKYERLEKEKISKFRIIYTGTISIRKGVIYLLEAFDELDLENSELLLIGDIDSDVNFRLNKYKKNKKIIFKKSMNQRDLGKFYNNSDVFVLNSIEDGFGMVILQAMACGLPVITTKNTGGSEIIEDEKDGFIIPIRSKEVLKKKIFYLYNNPKHCSEMGMIAKDKISKNYSWESYGKRQVDIYLSLLNNN
tara:strand:+ start:478 stop:1632 length:1155 start_codon:yes stop_codon:yes gene_type:complete